LNEKDVDESAFKSTFWYLICDFITRGIAFITMPIFTRLMSTSEIGSFSILTSWISILSVIVTLNLVQSVFLAKFDYKENYNEFISTISILGIVSALSCYILILPFRSEVAHLLFVEDYALDVMFVHLMFCQISSILLAKYRSNFEYKKLTFLTVFTALVVTISSLLCTAVFDDSLKGRIYGTYAPMIIINLYLFIFYMYNKGAFRKEYCRYALVICVPLIIHNLAGNLMHSADRVMIGKFCSKEETGLYGVAYTCAMFANVIRNSMNSAWNPWVFEKLSNNKILEVKKASYIYLMVFFLLCIGIILLAPEVIFVLGGEAYLSAKYVVPPVVSAYMFSMVYSLYAGVEQYYKMQRYFALFAVPCALLNIILNYFFIPAFGYIAAAYTTMASLALECLLHYINVRKMSMAYIYNGKFNAFIIVAMLGVTLGSIATYQSDVIRYGVLLGVVAISIVIGIRYKNIVNSFIPTRWKISK